MLEGLESTRGAKGVAADDEVAKVEAVGPAVKVGALGAGVAGEDVVAVAVVDGAEDVDGFEDLGVAEGELFALVLFGVHGRVGEQLGFFEVEQLFVLFALDSHEGAGTASVAVLDCCDDVAAAGEFADVVGVVTPRAGIAVGEDHDGELFKVILFSSLP